MSLSACRWTTLLLAACWATIPITAGEERWTLQGPEDGSAIFALVVDPQRPAVLYAGTDGAGVFRSTDGGDSWRSASEGLTSLAVYDFAFDPANSRVIYAATTTGVFRSADGGGSWRQRLEGVEGEWRILVDPNDGRRLWAGVEEDLFTTADGGDSWRQLRGLAPGKVFQLTALAIDPEPPATLYAGAQGGPGCMFCDVTFGVFRSGDGGQSWARVFTEIDVDSLVVDPGAAGTVYAGAALWLYRSTDGGDSWPQIADLETVAHTLELDPSDAQVMYAGTRSKGLLKSADGGVTWTPMNQGLVDFRSGRAQTRVRAVAPDPATPGVLWAGTASVHGGVFSSRDGGANWARRDAGIRNTPIESVAVGTGGRAYGAGRYGLYRTADSGATWELALPVEFLRAVAVDPTDPDTVYAARDYAHNGLTDIVFKSSDGGDSWTALEQGLEPADSRALAVAPSDPQILYLGAERTGSGTPGVYRSADGGATWGLTNLVFDTYTLAVDPTDPDTVLAGGLLGLFRSTDGGGSWTEVLDVTTVNAAVFASSDPRIAYAAGWFSGTWRSTDGGQTWTRLPGNGRALAVDPSDPDVVYGGDSDFFRDNAGIIRRSLDGGATWFELDPGLHATRLVALAIDPDVPGRLVAGSLGGGVLAGHFAPPAPLSAFAGRFSLRAAWRDHAGRIGAGVPVTLTGKSGYFWFFGANNVELVAKVLDGRAFNDNYWVFYGAMSNVGYQLTVTDNLTRRHRTYVNQPGTFASVGDIDAFLDVPLPAATAASVPAPDPIFVSPAKSGCAAGSETLCLHGERFTVEIEWQDPQGRTGTGRAVPLTADSGYFWFFEPGNVELAVKVLDGRSLNGHYWVFYGALSNLRYTLTVTDTETGASRTYFNPPERFSSAGDIAAF